MHFLNTENSLSWGEIDSLKLQSQQCGGTASMAEVSLEQVGLTDIVLNTVDPRSKCGAAVK